MGNNSETAKNLIEILFAVTHLCRNEIKHTRGGLKITFTQFKILSAIRRGVTQISLLSEELNTSQPAMSKMVDILVKGGFLRRASSKEDRRKILIELTRKGESAYGAVREKICTAISERFEQLSARERQHAEVSVMRMLEALSQD